MENDLGKRFLKRIIAVRYGNCKIFLTFYLKYMKVESEKQKRKLDKCQLPFFVIMNDYIVICSAAICSTNLYTLLKGTWCLMETSLISSYSGVIL